MIRDGPARCGDRAANLPATRLGGAASRAKGAGVRAQTAREFDPARGMFGNVAAREDALVPANRVGHAFEFRHSPLEQTVFGRSLGRRHVRVRHQFVERGQRVGEAAPNHRLRTDRENEPGRGDGAQRTRQDRFEAGSEKSEGRRVVRTREHRENQRHGTRPVRVVDLAQPQSEIEDDEDRHRFRHAARRPEIGERGRGQRAGQRTDETQHTLVRRIAASACTAADDEGRQDGPTPMPREG
jgi:hypothetical protein